MQGGPAWFHRWDTEQRIFFIGERRPPPRCEWRDCQIRIATASAQVWYFVCWIKNSSHPIFSEKNIWQVIICVKQAICCGDTYLFFADLSCARLIYSYFDMHCKCHKCDRGAKGGPPYMMWLQELHALHTWAKPGYSERRPISPSTAHLLEHSSLNNCKNLPRAITPLFPFHIWRRASENCNATISSRKNS